MRWSERVNSGRKSVNDPCSYIGKAVTDKGEQKNLSKMSPGGRVSGYTKMLIAQAIG